jgi:hypothetical protein
MTTLLPGMDFAIPSDPVTQLRAVGDSHASSSLVSDYAAPAKRSMLLLTV